MIPTLNRNSASTSRIGCAGRSTGSGRPMLSSAQMPKLPSPISIETEPALPSGWKTSQDGITKTAKV